MMIDVENIKRKIIEYIQKNGPSLPVKIAKTIEMEPVFASAIISELTSGQQLKMSKMKVGASQLFLIEGQEQQLEKYAEEYFKNVEKRAYLSLKQNKYLIDEEQEPAIRVALRGLKDFATPFKYQEKIMWRYNFTKKEEILRLLTNSEKSKEPEEEDDSENSEGSQKEETTEEQSESTLTSDSQLNSASDPTPEPELTSQPDTTSTPESELISQPAPIFQPTQPSQSDPIPQVETQTSTPQSHPTPTSQSEKPQVTDDENKTEQIKPKTLFVKPSFESPFRKQKEYSKPSDPQKESTPFADEVKSYLERKHINLIKELEESRNEFIGIIKINSDLGKVKYLLIARNKKTINDQDIIVAHQKSSEHKMPCYFLHKGKVAKKSLSTLEQYANLIKVQEI